MQKTFEGEIELEHEKGVYEPASSKGDSIPEEEKPLEEIIDKINEQYKGAFTEADRVLVTALRGKLINDENLKNVAQTSDPRIFAESVFPKAFSDVAQDCYMESQDAFTSLFADQAKYNAIMHALGSIIYREMRKDEN